MGGAQHVYFTVRAPYEENPDKNYQTIRACTSDFNFTDARALKNPIMDIAARFWEDERYDVFKIGYRSMRIIDYLVDDVKSRGDTISEAEKRYLVSRINEWIQTIEDGQHNDANQSKLVEALKRFHIPLKPWRKLAESIIFDIHYNGFSTFQNFLTYSEGAAVAPGSLFTFLCGLEKLMGNIIQHPLTWKRSQDPLHCTAT